MAQGFLYSNSLNYRMASADHALIFFAHGARDPQWAAPFDQIRGRVAAALPEVPVRLAFLELMQPSLAAAVDALAAQGVERVTLVPLFLAQGGHLKEDLPALLEAIGQQHPALRFRVTPPIGEVETILAAIADWAESEYRAVFG